MELGLACSVCGHLNQLRAVVCDRCAGVLAPQPIPPSAVLLGLGAAARPITQANAAASSPATVPLPSPAATSQSSPVKPPSTVISSVQPVTAAPPAAQPRFNAVTGAPLEASQGKPAAKTMFFGALQQQHVVPRLVVIKGEGGDGVTYHLSATNHVVGRSTGEIRFNEDFFLSPEHALFSVQGNRLFAKDLGSINGVFVRIKSPVPLDHGDCFLVGEQLLRLDSAPFNEPGPDANHTYSYTSPRPDARFRVVQLLAGGGEGRIVSAQATTLTLGREANHMNFPQDRFISGRHARLDSASDSHHIILTDTGSRNGTFVRIKGAVELFHGDYIFIGQQLLRVEIS
ncbi:FHA domain-containing protein [Nannocystis bainbridge]|uniref:FHA domain-containing protein n=1 Tax=Nannocystis bainbridge TaxID=2995303 RepID=A0ABT5E1E4_9BACT|nr:FHA domain-containing protein [Nannocystis bainbridge]MDC0719625.1 FHA domain-containing protein [Nannocystis bainbridge]